jgi:hypothetical protein
MFPCIQRPIGLQAFRLLLLLPVAASAGTSPKDPVAPPVTRPADRVATDRFYFSAGWMWRETGGVDLRARSRSRHQPLPSLFPASGAALPPVGATDSFADRLYSDGRVLVDGGTDRDGATSNWGYDRESQVQDGSLRYHASGHRWESASSARDLEAIESAIDGSGGSPVVELGWEHSLSHTVALGAQLQWSFLDVDGSLDESRDFAWQSRSDFALDFTDTFDLQGVVPPEAPYQGSGEGFGPLIDNQPTRREVRERAAGGGRVRFFNRLENEIDIRLHTVSAGPMVRGQIGPLSGFGGLGLALNIVDWEASQTEALAYSRDDGSSRLVRAWSDRRQGTDVLPGVYLHGGLSWAVTPSLWLTAFGRYDWSESLNETVGVSSFSFDPGGWSGGVLLGWSFR